ncbi:hypothetical protein Q5450_17865 [Escherichia coli]|uniref:hypothetical protein n=1 Tax=Escherichia coli TaxID=562 RepID=UPI00200D5AD1|nr:hypothetical protein [Escherichia coli]MCL0906276.1 hypothetical protein [Escherichia coli]MCN6794048.1 hypothetical protein [Escherichia coli]MED8357375.1 hypothetical protein [Escherichia coli]
MLNIIHAKFSLLSNVVASGLNDFRPLSKIRGGGERFSAVKYCGTDEYLYRGLVEKRLFHALFLQIFLYGKRVCYGLIHKEMHLGVGLKIRWLMLLCQEGQGKVLYRYALAIACAADGDEMPIKKPEFDEGRTQASV